MFVALTITFNIYEKVCFVMPNDEWALYLMLLCFTCIWFTASHEHYRQFYLYPVQKKIK